jgi:uncharacterized repeat protein (TIGR01451 family)
MQCARYFLPLRARRAAALCALALELLAHGAVGAAGPPAAVPPTAPVPGFEARLRGGAAVDVIVEFDGSAAKAAAATLRRSRGLVHDDAAVVAARAARYRGTKAAVEQALRGAGAAAVRDYAHLPLALWHIDSPAALARLRAHPAFRAVYEDRRVFAVATPSDLALIQQPAAAAAGATGAGTTVVVIDAGINLANSAFGTCPTVGVAGCRVIYNLDYYPGSGSDVNHGTNVSGIVAEAAPQTRIAMHNVFNGAGATTSDILTAIDWAISNQAVDTIVAINMSLGDGGDYTSSCTSVGGGGNPLQSAVATAAAAGIQTVAASGNNAYTGGINFPGCTPGVVSVGAVYDSAIAGVSYPSVPCTDASPAADQVTCFTNMASFLTVLAPGAAVTAAGITESGTSQATPHVSGVLAALRGLYPKEPLSQAVDRLTLTGTLDPRGAIAIPRINEYAAATAGAQLQLTGSGPSTATAGGTASYVLTVKNTGPLIATNVVVTDSLPALAVFVSGPGCSAAGATVSCTIASLAVGASISFTINVRWSGSGAVYDSATASGDQIDPVPALATVAFGTPPGGGAVAADVPLPPWSLLLLATVLAAAGLRGTVPAAPRRPGTRSAAGSALVTPP